MGGLVVNCKKCNKVFQQRLHPICPECVKRGDEQLTLLYRKLQESASYGGISIEVLSDYVGMPKEEIEQFYLEGRLSTAGIYLKMRCQACDVMCGESERRGRYCLKCSELMASKARVEVKPLHEIRKEEEIALKREQEIRLKQQAAAQANSHASNREHRFGAFIRK